MADQLPHLYETEVEWTEQKKGRLTSPGLPSLEVATPPEFQGHEGMWSPEHYFVSSINACFMTTFLAISQMSKLEFVSFRAKAQGKLERVEGQGMQITEIILRPQLVIRYSRDLERAGRILEKAEKNCFISNSVKSRIKLEPELLRAAEG
jgi:organic hydroperoxide reductase OsmC/OhrA